MDKCKGGEEIGSEGQHGKVGGELLAGLWITSRLGC